MTQGYTRPFSPSGAASTVLQMPWTFAGDLTLIHFRCDPAALARYLPAPLTPLDDSGEAFLWSPKLSCHPTHGDLSGLDPAQLGYNVCVIGLPALLDGKPTLFSAFQWCDRDWLVVLSWFIGATSKGAVIEQTSVHPLMAHNGSPHDGAPGHRFTRTVSRFGQRVIDMSFTPERETRMEDLSFYTAKLPLTGMRHMPDLELPPRGKPLVHDLVQQIMSGVHFGTPLAGAATLNFHDAANEDLLPLQPLEVFGGYVIPMTFVLEGVKVVHDYLDTGE